MNNAQFQIPGIEAYADPATAAEQARVAAHIALMERQFPSRDDILNDGSQPEIDATFAELTSPEHLAREADKPTPQYDGWLDAALTAQRHDVSAADAALSTAEMRNKPVNTSEIPLDVSGIFRVGEMLGYSRKFVTNKLPTDGYVAPIVSHER